MREILSLKHYVYTSILLLIFTPMLDAQTMQQPHYWQHHTSPVFSFERIGSPLPLRTDMPLEVMVGYIFYDSLARSLSTVGVDETYKNFTYSDTLRYAMKYCYTMMDYNPVLFEQFRRYNNPLRRSASMRSTVFEKLTEKIKTVSPEPFVETLLCQSSIIAHISVIDTFRTTDGALTNHIVTSTILDTIKGKVLPQCLNFYPKPNITATPSSCLQFVYPLEWQRLPFHSNVIASGSTMVDSAGIPWVRKNTEYIVFLTFAQACSDSAHTYHILNTFGERSSANNIYPIIDGKVQDPNNDFGLGITPSVATLKNMLRQKISTITHFGE